MLKSKDTNICKKKNKKKQKLKLGHTETYYIVRQIRVLTNKTTIIIIATQN